MLKVFVYGTLKPGEANYQDYCQGKVIEIIKAQTKGKLFDLSIGYPAMIEGNSIVKGFLLTFAHANHLALLDQLEDYDPQGQEYNNIYYRQEILVTKDTGESLGTAWGYFMSLQKVKQLGGLPIKSGWWTPSTRNQG